MNRDIAPGRRSHTSPFAPLKPHNGTPKRPTGGWRALWHSFVAGIGLVTGLVPHVLHHIGLLLGTALVAGSGGTLLFGALGLVASIPLLVRLYRRFRTWRAPAIGLLTFAAMFSVSAFVIGPVISGSGGQEPAPAPSSHHTESH